MPEFQTDYAVLFTGILTEENVFQVPSLLVIKLFFGIVPVCIPFQNRIYGREIRLPLFLPFDGGICLPVLSVECKDESFGVYAAFAEKQNPVSCLEFSEACRSAGRDE